MNLQQDGSRFEFVATGGLNRIVGWTMLVVGMALAAVLDPWFFAAQSASEYANSIRPAIRHVQGVVLGMAILQLSMAHLLATSAFDRKACQTVAMWITSGAAIYTIGYALGLAWPSCHWLVLIGSGLNFSGFAYLLWVKPSGEFAPQIRIVLRVVCLGMLLDFVAGVFQLLPPQLILEHFGGDDGVRLRMMRLARVAMILLSTLTLLYYGVARHAEQRTARWGGLALAWGAIGMPSILAAACFTSLYLKYLLMLPSTAVLIGVFLGLTFALRYASPLEGWGWALIAGSTSVGMLMGLYAFDGPLRAPEFLGEYNQMPRRLSRLAHSYCIVLGVLAIFLARELKGKRAAGEFARLGVRMFAVGSALTVSILAAQIVVPFSPYMLSLGPALAVTGLIISLKVTCFRRVG